MIQIEDDDKPIDIVIKMIKATKIYKWKSIISSQEIESIIARFELSELKEIAEYLLVYYNNHKGEEENE